MPEVEFSTLECVFPKSTGLKMLVFIGIEQCDVESHGAQVQVAVDYTVPGWWHGDNKYFCIKIADDPQIVGDVHDIFMPQAAGDMTEEDVVKAQDFVCKNHITLMQLWKEELHRSEVKSWEKA